MSKCAAEPQTCLYISAERSSLSTEMDISVSGSSASATTAESRDSGCLCGFFYCGQDRDENTDKSKGEQNKSDINPSAGGSVTVVSVPQAIKCREHLWGVRRGRQSINFFISEKKLKSWLKNTFALKATREPPPGERDSDHSVRLWWILLLICARGCSVFSVTEYFCHHNSLVFKQLGERIACVLTALCPCLREKEERELMILSWPFTYHGRDKSTCDVTNSEGTFMLPLLGCFFYPIFLFCFC